MHSIEAFAHPSIALGNTNYNYNKLKQSFNQLSVLPNKSFDLMEIGIILGQEAYELRRPLDYKIGTQSEPFAVLTELECVVSGLMMGKKRQNVCHFAFTEDVKVAENIQTWWDIETYASKINVVSQSKKEMQAQKMLDSTTKFTDERYEVGMLWSEPEPNLPNNYRLAPGSALLTGAKIPKGPKPEEFVSTVNRYRCRKRIRKDIGRVRSERHLRERMVFATPSSAKPEQAWQSKTCLQCCVKVQRHMPK